MFSVTTTGIKTNKMSSASIYHCFAFRCKPVFHYKSNFSVIRKHWRYSKSSSQKPANIKYALVLDFEATCHDKEKITQEIIEFPCLKVNTSNFRVEDTFHEYVKPVVNPELSTFCMDLTGIIQEMVDTSDQFPKVLQRFHDWREMNGLTSSNSVYVTSGDWDLGRMLPRQCDLSGLPIPPDMFNWIDLKMFYGRATGFVPKSLREAIQKCGLSFQGRQHSGIDDCINIANVLRKLSHDDFTPTSQLVKTANGYHVLAYPSA